MSLFKKAMFISRVCEDYSCSESVSIKKDQSFITVIFSYTNEELITYRFRKDFYDINIKSFLENDSDKDAIYRIKSKPVEIF